MAAATGISPVELANLDRDLYDGVSLAVRDRWGHQEELLALIYETLGQLVHMFGRVNFKNWPKKAIHERYPRPGESLAAEPTQHVTRASIRATMMGGR